MYLGVQYKVIPSQLGVIVQKQKTHEHKILAPRFLLPMYQVHRFSVGCSKHARIAQGLMIMCSTRSSGARWRRRLFVGRQETRRRRDQSRTSLEDRDLLRTQVGRLRKPSGNTQPQSSSLTLSKVCRLGIDRLDRSRRLSAWATGQ